MLVTHVQKAVALLRTQGTEQVDMCLPKIDLLLAVASLPGRSPSEYAATCGFPESTVNRHIRELREGPVGPRRGKSGLGLLTSRPCAADWRRHEVCLTRKGELLMEHLLAILNR
jgi:DNA-binding MarR family transcriptional regulator